MKSKIDDESARMRSIARARPGEMLVTNIYRHKLKYKSMWGDKLLRGSYEKHFCLQA